MAIQKNDHSKIQLIEQWLICFTFSCLSHVKDLNNDILFEFLDWYHRSNTLFFNPEDSFHPKLN